ncbi:MAG: acylphosphatase [Parcubacteria group bacterium]
MITVEFDVRGRVQGVFLRAMIQEQATQKGLTGYVKNTPEGSVRIVCQGNPDAINALGAWLKSNPGSSQIDDVTVSQLDTNMQYSHFTTKYS